MGAADGKRGGQLPRDPVSRLSRLRSTARRPNAAAQLVERKSVMAQLRQRLAEAQAQGAVETTRARTGTW